MQGHQVLLIKIKYIKMSQKTLKSMWRIDDGLQLKIKNGTKVKQ